MISDVDSPPPRERLKQASTVVRLHFPVFLRWLPAVIAVLVVLDLLALWSTYYLGHGRLFGLIAMVRLDLEKNIPTFVSASLLVLCALLTAQHAKTAWHHSRAEARYWAGMAVAFTFVALDEWFSWHEQLIRPVREALNLSGYLYYGWVVPYGVAVLILAALYLRFLWRLPAPFRRRLFIAAGLFLGGAVGMELVGGAYFDGNQERRDFGFGLITMVEETLELSGAAVALRAFVLGFGFDELRLITKQRVRDGSIQFE